MSEFKQQTLEEITEEFIEKDKQADDLVKRNKKSEKIFKDVVNKIFKTYGLKKNFQTINAFILGMQHNTLDQTQHSSLILALMSERHKARNKK